MTLVALLLGLSVFALPAPTQPRVARTLTAYVAAPRFALDAILDGLRATESGGQKNGGRDATGDGGRAIGPYQIHRAYFLDAGIAGRYEECRDPEYSRRVVVGYWKRWCPDALERCDAEVLARGHNGGPQGARKSSTLAFWAKVEKRLLAAATPSGSGTPEAGAAWNADPTLRLAGCPHLAQ